MVRRVGWLQGLNVNLMFATVIIVFGSSFQFGYNIGVLNQVDEVQVQSYCFTDLSCDRRVLFDVIDWLVTIESRGVLHNQAWALSWNSRNLKSCPEFLQMSLNFWKKENIAMLWVHKHLCQLVKEWTPMPMWTSDPTVDSENWRAYSYCDTAEGMKQTVHLYYWVRVTTVCLDDFNGTFSACLRGFKFCKNDLKF